MRETRSVRSKGVNLHVVVDGSPAAPAMALINCALGNVGIYEPVVERLSAGHRLVRHDWRGSGKSDGGARPDYSFPQYADDLRAILDAVEVDRAVVVGSAYGARTAARFALRYPERTALLALFDVSLDQPVDQTRQRALVDEARRLRDEAGLPSPALDRSWFEHSHDKEALRSLTAHRNLPDPTHELAGLTVPTLVACGRQDENLGQAQRIAGLMPDCELHTMEMTSHPAILSRPALFCELLLDFLERRGA